MQELAEKHGWYLARQFENEAKAKSGVVCLCLEHLMFAGFFDHRDESPVVCRAQLRFALRFHQANPAYHACASDGESRARPLWVFSG